MSSRFGYNMATTVALEDGIVWAAENGFRYVDFQTDLSPNDLASFDDARVKRVRDLCEEHNVKIGVHPSSAINNAEYVPILPEAVDDYVNANFDLAVRLGCCWMVGHGGYHFGDLALRLEVVIERMKRLVDRAEKTDVTIYFENHNLEPEHAEIHYLPHNVEETQWFFDTIQSDHFKWAFNVAHGHLVPEGWSGFLDAFGVDNIGQVRVNDNNGDYEVHLVPGEGTIDFEAVLKQLNERGYKEWFSLGFGNEVDKIRARDWFEAMLKQ